MYSTKYDDVRELGRLVLCIKCHKLLGWMDLERVQRWVPVGYITAHSKVCESKREYYYAR